MNNFTIFNEVAKELADAERKFPAFNSAHEGWAVLKEEVDELWEEVRKKRSKRDLARMRSEGIQVAAMAIRFIKNICDKEQSND